MGDRLIEWAMAFILFGAGVCLLVGAWALAKTVGGG